MLSSQAWSSQTRSAWPVIPRRAGRVDRALCSPPAPLLRSRTAEQDSPLAASGVVRAAEADVPRLGEWWSEHKSRKNSARGLPPASLNSPSQLRRHPTGPPAPLSTHATTMFRAPLSAVPFLHPLPLASPSRFLSTTSPLLSSPSRRLRPPPRKQHYARGLNPGPPSPHDWRLARPKRPKPLGPEGISLEAAKEFMRGFYGREYERMEEIREEGRLKGIAFESFEEDHRPRVEGRGRQKLLWRYEWDVEAEIGEEPRVMQ